MATCSRTSGVAPLSVHFDAEVAASTATVRHFHDYEYRWDFGDTGAGTWGTTGKSKNTAKGGVATHVYETAGTYSAALLVVDIDGYTIEEESFEITVSDPDTVYAGTLTICVSDATSNDFTGAPSGSTHIATDDLTTIDQLATAGYRILFRRGSTWTSSGLTFPNNAGPVTLGAYGSGDRPQITMTGGSFCAMDSKQNWRIMDLSFVYGGGSVFGGILSMQRILLLRIKTDGFDVGIGWSHWNDNSSIVIDQMVLVDCECINNISYAFYGGAERIAIMGSTFADCDITHVLRCWQAYKGVIQHNRMSGASLTGSLNRHAMKLHGPGDTEFGPLTPGTSQLRYRTSFAMVSDNVFGSSGAWPVMISPQDAGADEVMFDIIFERNRFSRQFGTQTEYLTIIAVHVAADYTTLRNNIIDATGASDDLTGIYICEYGPAGPHTGVECYNNTIYCSNNTASDVRYGFHVDASNTDTVIRNNLVSFPGTAALEVLIDDDSSDLVQDHNLLTDTPYLVDPDNATPLSRDFDLEVTSGAIDQGTDVAVFEDFSGESRPVNEVFDIGAYEYGSGEADPGQNISWRQSMSLRF